MLTFGFSRNLETISVPYLVIKFIEQKRQRISGLNSQFVSLNNAQTNKQILGYLRIMFFLTRVAGQEDSISLKLTVLFVGTENRKSTLDYMWNEILTGVYGTMHLNKSTSQNS